MTASLGSSFGYKSSGTGSGGKSSQTASQSRKLSQSVSRSANRTGPFGWLKRGHSGFGEQVGAKGLEGSKERLHSTDAVPVRVGDVEKGGTARYEMEITDVELGGMKGAKESGTHAV